MAWAKSEQHLTLRNGRFRDQVAALAAPMHGITKDELEGEDIREQCRTSGSSEARSSAYPSCLSSLSQPAFSHFSNTETPFVNVTLPSLTKSPSKLTGYAVLMSLLRLNSTSPATACDRLPTSIRP
jgi:hypothetical protein